MMCSSVLLALIISKIFLARVPPNIICILGNFVAYPDISHFHGTQMLAFDHIICYTGGCIAVTVDLRFWLRMPKFFQREAKKHAFFAIKKKSAKFGFGGQCNDETENCT